MEDSATVYELHAATLADPNFKRLTQARRWPDPHSLKQWISSFVGHDMLVVRDIFDLTIGRAIASLLEAVTGEEFIDKAAFATATPKNYQLIMGLVVQFVERRLGVAQDPKRWTLKGILAQDMSSLLCLLVDLATLLKCPYPLPPNMIGGAEKTKTTVHRLTDEETVTDEQQSAGPEQVVDAFDALVDSPQKFQELVELLLHFTNMHLAVVNIEARDLASLDDGVHLIILIGVLANFFVPMNLYHLTPTLPEHKARSCDHNVQFALELMRDLGIDVSRINPKDVVSGDLTTICRWIFLLYTNFQDQADA
ncbi:hypothetical protein HK105_209034 [Polyrhizophydium stewartii]|uniref:Calponin-homology (CH) domain-containing protein n=1 Tax=Polyrhizophydium stewartii TaxID=2732419 RepID=A0ABR4MW44_9FUNG